MDLLKWFREDSPPLQEEAQAFPEQSFFSDSRYYNPESLIWKRSSKVFAKMKTDAQVKAAYDFKVNAIVSRPWMLEIEAEEEGQEEIKEFLIQNFEQNFKGTFQLALKAILDSLRVGFSITEKIWDTIDFKGSPKWGLVALKLRPFESFTFIVDPFGNVEEIQQEQTGRVVSLDPDKFIHHIHEPEHDPIYGLSDLKAVFDPWHRKILFQKFKAIYLERMGGGFTNIKSTQLLTGAQKDQAENILLNLSSRSGVITPPGAELEITFPKGGESAFDKAINSENKEISKALLVPNLLGVSEQGSVGSEAQAKVQLEAFFMSVTAEANALADRITEDIIRPLVRWNFGEDKKTPIFKFDSISDSQKKAMAESWVNAVNGQIVVNTDEDEARTRDLLDYPVRDMDEPVEREGVEEKEEEPPPPPRTFVEQTDFRRRPNTVQIKAFFDAEEEAMTKATTQATNAIFDDLMDRGASLAGVGPSAEIATLKVDIALNRKLNAAIAIGISNAFNMGQSDARSELQKSVALGQIGLTRKEYLYESVSIAGGQVGRFIEGMPTQTADEFFQGKSFTITGDVSDDILQQVKFGLGESIKEGDSIEEVRAKLEETLKPLIGQKDAAGKIINVPARVKTIARTNITEAYNEARLSTFTDPALDGFVVAMEYSAVIDSATTNFCRTMDGRIYRMESGMWSSPGGARRVPPAHFNCRSILIPVTEVDEFTESPPVPASVEPATGFGAAVPVQEA